MTKAKQAEEVQEYKAENACVVILSGIPCSGKSTHAVSLWQADLRNTAIVSRDAIREDRTRFKSPYVYNSKNETLVTKYFWEDINRHSFMKRNIIIDNTSCEKKYIDAIINYYKKSFPDYHILITFFDISFSKAMYRNFARYFWTGKWIPIKVMRKFYRKYNSLNKQDYADFLY